MCVLSAPRGNGKSTLAAWLVVDALLDPNNAGREICIVSGSIEQSRHIFRPVRAFLEEHSLGWKFRESSMGLGAYSKTTATRLRVASSNAKTMFGLVNVPLLIADEPASWEVIGGYDMFQAIRTSQGKPDSDLKCVFIGTLAPARDGWWPDLVKEGTNKEQGVYVKKYGITFEQLDNWKNKRLIKSCNPLIRRYPDSMKVLEQERLRAEKDPDQRAQFVSYRLNYPQASETKAFNVDEWRVALNRDLAKRSNQPVWGVDLGAGRSWSSICAYWHTGRLEALAVMPGIPSVEEFEEIDHAPGIYTKLLATGRLSIAEGRRMPLVKDVIKAALERFGEPYQIVCDRFRVGEIRDACDEVFGGGVELIARAEMWSEGADDMRRTRKHLLDGNLVIEPTSAPLVIHSLGVARLETDNVGNVRIKKGPRNRSRDDVAVGMLRAVGQADRLVEEASNTSQKVLGL